MPKPFQRRGVILIVLMVFLAVAMVIVTSWLKLAGVERRELRSQQTRAQAEWLAESAINRAAAKLAADASYSGETWKISADDFGGQQPAEVLIRIEPVDGQSDRKQIAVQADYPVDPVRRTRRTKSIWITIPTQGDPS